MVAQVARVAFEKLEERRGAAAVFIGDVAADHDKLRRLGGRHVVGLHRVRADARIAAGDKVDRIGGLGRHRAKRLFGRIHADAKAIVGIGLEAGQLGAKDCLVGHRKRPGRVVLLLPGVGAQLGKVDRALGRVFFAADPLHRHRGRRVALPGQEQRGRLERRRFGKRGRRDRLGTEQALGIAAGQQQRTRLQEPSSIETVHGRVSPIREWGTGLRVCAGGSSQRCEVSF